MKKKTVVISSLAGLLICAAAVILLASSRHRRPEEPPEESVSVVSFNIGDSIRPFPGASEVLAILREIPAADVYLLQEIRDERMMRELVDGLSRSSEPYHYRYDRPSRAGIISNRFIEKSAVHPDYAALMIQVRSGNGESIRFVSVHLPYFWKPRSSEGNAAIGPIYGTLRIAREALTPNGRSRTIDGILHWLDGFEPVPTVVGGDFNTVPLTLAPRRMTPAYRDALKGSGDFWTGTYRRIEGSVSPRVDFVFHSREMEVRDAFVHPDSSGDHLPVYARILLPGN